MFNISSLPGVPAIPPKYQPLIEPARKIGARLGDLIADGWDNLVDKVFSSTTSSKRD